jgi:D-glycero-D-manno-heptose 1,7-bisphosphate phosphatase
MMIIVILCGGLGSRLGDLTRFCPKPMLEVAGRPFLFYLLRQMAGFGFRRFLLLAGHLGQVVQEYFSQTYIDGLPKNIMVETLVEPEPLGTAGALRAAADRLDDRFLFCNGDSFFQCDIAQLTRPFPSPAVWGRLALTRAVGSGRFGAVLVEGSQITGFREKAETEGVGSEFMNMGLYLLSRDILSAIPPGQGSLETDIFPGLARQGRLEAQVFEPALFIDLGVPDEFARAQTALPKALADQENPVSVL